MYRLELLYLCLPFSDDSLYLWFEAFHSCLLDPLGFLHSPLLMMQLVCRCCHLLSLGQFRCIAGKWTELCWTNLELKSNLFQPPPPQLLWQEEVWKTFFFLNNLHSVEEHLVLPTFGYYTHFTMTLPTSPPWSWSCVCTCCPSPSL